MLLLTVLEAIASNSTTIPLKPSSDPVPEALLIVMEPIELLAIVLGLALKSPMPMAGTVLFVVELVLMTMVDVPSRLPMVFPVVVPMLHGASWAGTPHWIPIKLLFSVLPSLRAVVSLIPEMVLPWML